MKIVDFNRSHIQNAMDLALECYEEERNFVGILPKVKNLPDLTSFADNGFGVTALENGEMVGFLCCYSPFNDAFGTYARGTFSPIHAHGAITCNRENIYKHLYQASAEKLVIDKVSSHAISLYAHDKKAINAFYNYGFGLRCIDAIRPMDTINTPSCSCNIRQLDKSEAMLVKPLRVALDAHLEKSPCFLYNSKDSIDEQRDTIIYVAIDKIKKEIIAFIEVRDEGENFVTEESYLKNICGAYCLPEYRGKGIALDLLNFTLSSLNIEGYTHLGVDFESFNPTGAGFWLKYFTPYTNSVVRRIDEKTLEV